MDTSTGSNFQKRKSHLSCHCHWWDGIITVSWMPSPHYFGRGGEGGGGLLYFIIMRTPGIPTPPVQIPNPDGKLYMVQRFVADFISSSPPPSPWRIRKDLPDKDKDKGMAILSVPSGGVGRLIGRGSYILSVYLQWNFRCAPQLPAPLPVTRWVYTSV